MGHSRREFLVRTAGGAALIAAAGSMPGFMSRSARAAAAAGPGERVLVIIQLTGGNDGLNTVIPIEDDLYHRARPTLRVDPGAAHRLGDSGLALHPEMEAMRGLFDDGELSVINNVGYPNPDRSHFRSMDIWHTCDLSPESDDRGWIGRLADERFAPGRAPMAVHVDDVELPRALAGERAVVPSIPDLDALELDGDAEAIIARADAARADATEDLLFVQRVAVASCRHAAKLKGVAHGGQTGAEYPQFRLAQKLSQIAALIDAGFGARVYYTSLGGFDTHARQELSHPALLRELSDSVAAFQRDLKARGLTKRVATMTFSEFGRRVAENGSRGTDHGAAAPMFIVGSSVRRGIHGGAPDLTNLTEGDVRHRIDFRGVYAGVLESWLDIRPEPVVGAVERVDAL